MILLNLKNYLHQYHNHLGQQQYQYHENSRPNVFDSQRVNPLRTEYCYQSRKDFHNSTRYREEISDHYARLGLKRNCSQTDIKKAFFELSKLYHPDKVTKDGDLQTDSKHAHDRFVKLSAAYSVLSDSSARRAYDFKLQNRNILNRTPPGGTAGGSVHHTAYSPPIYPQSAPKDNWVTGSGRHFLIMTFLCTVAVIGTLEWVKHDIEKARRDAILTSSAPADTLNYGSRHPTRLEILRAELSHRRRKRLEHERNEFLLKKKNSEGLDATETEPIHSDGPNPA